MWLAYSNGSRKNFGIKALICVMRWWTFLCMAFMMCMMLWDNNYMGELMSSSMGILVK